MFLLAIPIGNNFPVSLKSFKHPGLFKPTLSKDRAFENYEKHFLWGPNGEQEPAVISFTIDKKTNDPTCAYLATSFAKAMITLNEIGLPTSIMLSAERSIIKGKLKDETLDVRAGIGENGVEKIERYFPSTDIFKDGIWRSVEELEEKEQTSKLATFEIILLGLHIDIFNKVLIDAMREIRLRQIEYGNTPIN